MDHFVSRAICATMLREDLRESAQLGSQNNQLVTVIIATYNAMPFLRQAVNSILAQTISMFHLIIVNDASSDGTTAYLETLAGPRVTVIHLTVNSGQGVARNIALMRCHTKYTAIMDGDDWSEPGRLAAQVDFLETNPSVGAVGTQFSYLGTEGRMGFGAPLPCRHQEIYSNLLNGRHAIVNGSACFRTSLLKASGGYASSRVGEDWDIFLRVGEKSMLANLDRRFYLYRVHRECTSANHLAQMRLNYAFAASNARRRAAGLEDLSLDCYLDALQRRSLIKRASNNLELHALAQYRSAIADVLHGHAWIGYSRLFAAAMMSPAWTARRMKRMFRAPEKIPNHRSAGSLLNG